MILDLMDVPGLTRENVANHLQKYRLYLRRVSDFTEQPNMAAAFGIRNSNGKFNRKRKEEARVVWSADLHRKFVTAVNQLGIEKAIPKRILDLMDVEGITRENVASHLQKFRIYLKRVSVETQQANMENLNGKFDRMIKEEPRVVWSIDLHRKFVAAVNQLGILYSVPKRILDLMDIPGLTREDVASHLQRYRLYLKRLSGETRKANMAALSGITGGVGAPLIQNGKLKLKLET